MGEPTLFDFSIAHPLDPLTLYLLLDSVPDHKRHEAEHDKPTKVNGHRAEQRPAIRHIIGSMIPVAVARLRTNALSLPGRDNRRIDYG